MSNTQYLLKSINLIINKKKSVILYPILLINSKRDPINRYKVDSILPSAYEYVYNRAPEDFCHGKSKTQNFYSLTKLQLKIFL